MRSRRRYRGKLAEALRVGYARLEAGRPSVDAVVAAIEVLERSPLFNAGAGAVFTWEGRHELDASLMLGDTLRAGGVTGVRTVSEPHSAGVGGHGGFTACSPERPRGGTLRSRTGSRDGYQRSFFDGSTTTRATAPQGPGRRPSAGASCVWNRGCGGPRQHGHPGGRDVDGRSGRQALGPRGRFSYRWRRDLCGQSQLCGLRHRTW